MAGTRKSAPTRLKSTFTACARKWNRPASQSGRFADLAICWKKTLERISRDGARGAGRCLAAPSIADLAAGADVARHAFKRRCHVLLCLQLRDARVRLF